MLDHPSCNGCGEMRRSVSINWRWRSPNCPTKCASRALQPSSNGSGCRSWMKSGTQRRNKACSYSRNIIPQRGSRQIHSEMASSRCMRDSWCEIDRLSRPLGLESGATACLVNMAPTFKSLSATPDPRHQPTHILPNGNLDSVKRIKSPWAHLGRWLILLAWTAWGVALILVVV